MPRDLRAYLYDIVEACDLVADFTDGKSSGDYSADPLVRSAVERQLEIIGEALSQALRHHADVLADRIPEAPRVIAFRNQLAHGYASAFAAKWAGRDDDGEGRLPGTLHRRRTRSSKRSSACAAATPCAGWPSSARLPRDLRAYLSDIGAALPSRLDVPGIAS